MDQKHESNQRVSSHNTQSKVCTQEASHLKLSYLCLLLIHPFTQTMLDFKVQL